MIEGYKIINNIHDSKVSDKLLAFRKNVAFNQEVMTIHWNKK